MTALRDLLMSYMQVAQVFASISAVIEQLYADQGWPTDSYKETFKSYTDGIWPMFQKAADNATLTYDQCLKDLPDTKKGRWELSRHHANDHQKWSEKYDGGEMSVTGCHNKPACPDSKNMFTWDTNHGGAGCNDIFSELRYKMAKLNFIGFNHCGLCGWAWQKRAYCARGSKCAHRSKCRDLLDQDWFDL